MDYQEKQQRNHLKCFLKTCEEEFLELYNSHRERSMCSPEVMYNSYKTVEYIVESKLPGDFVEMGAWQGGMSGIVAEKLQRMSGKNRLLVYDTFEGHSKPNADELDIWGNNMSERYEQEIQENGSWAATSEENVREYILGIYDNAEVIKEKVGYSSVFDNIEEISCLRLDMDWYEPTLAALEKLYAKIRSGGILIIDDYGHHSGAKKAVDEYFSRRAKPMFMNINYSCIAGIKL